MEKMAWENRRVNAVGYRAMGVKRLSIGTAEVPVIDWRRTSPPTSRLQELERLGNEPLVGLEDAAVPGVRVDPERRIRKATSQIVRIARRHHAIVITVGDQDVMLDA